ncbi:MAG: tRNA lysidine(34) synthetase TilS [Desulfobacterium sp.]|nr:tRNA lysidine(34) synthetase TilS [Desulfobacterium sp.]
MTERSDRPIAKTKAPFIHTVCETLAAHRMLLPGQSVLLGVSGGPDSVALLLAFLAIKNEYRLNLGIAHINHTLRGEESLGDEGFVRNLAEAHALPFHLERVDVAALARKNRQSVEEAARDVRYAFFERICRENAYTKTALGHNLNDNAELILMNLLRGSGPKGLSGIPPTRDNWIIRPLMEQSREEIIAFLNAENQAYVTDSTNLETVFLRNRVRHLLIPLLEKEYNPGITQTLNRLSRILRDEEAWMETETGTVFERTKVEASDTQVLLCLDAFNALPTALKRRVARKALERVKSDLKRITLTHIDAIAQLAAATTPGESLDLPDRIRIIKQNNALCFKKESRPLREIGRAIKSKKRLQNKKKVFLA